MWLGRQTYDYHLKIRILGEVKIYWATFIGILCSISIEFILFYVNMDIIHLEKWNYFSHFSDFLVMSSKKVISSLFYCNRSNGTCAFGAWGGSHYRGDDELGGGMGRSSEKVELLGSLLRLVLQISARQWANREPSAGFSGLTKSRAS